MTAKGWYASHKVQCQAQCRSYRARHRERLAPLKKASAAAYYIANKEKCVTANLAWRDKNRLEKPWLRVLQCVRSRAKANGRAYELTNEWAAARWTGQCEITGLPFVIDLSRTPGPKPFSPTVDRIDQRRGYEPDNCRFILYCVNNFRGTMGDQEMLRVAQAILRLGHQAPAEGIAA